MDPGASDHSAVVELDPVRSESRARLILGPGGAILVESGLEEAEVRFYGSTNARPTTPSDGCDGGKAKFSCGGDQFLDPPDPLSNSDVKFT